MVAQRLDESSRRFQIESFLRRDEDPPVGVLNPIRRARVPFIPIGPEFNFQTFANLPRIEPEVALVQPLPFEQLPVPPVLLRMTEIPRPFALLQDPVPVRHEVAPVTPVRDQEREAPPINRVVSPRAHLCRICNVELSAEVEPILNHEGSEGVHHRVHRECMRTLYLESGRLNCPLERCSHQFNANSVFDPQEQSALIRRHKIVGFIAAAVLGATLTVGALCLFLVAVKAYVAAETALKSAYWIWKCSSPIIEKYGLEIITCIASLPVLIVFNGGTLGLFFAIRKIGSCFHRYINPGKFEFEEAFNHFWLTLASGSIVSVALNIQGIGVLASFGLISGAISGLSYLYKTRRVTSLTNVQ